MALFKPITIAEIVIFMIVYEIPERPSQLFKKIPAMVFHLRPFIYIGLNTSRDVAKYKTWINPIKRRINKEKIKSENVNTGE